MKEYLEVNEDPINQIAKEHLLQQKVDLDPGWVYSLQLLVWGLEEEVLEVNEALCPNLLSWAIQLWGPEEDPEAAFKFLIGVVDENEVWLTANQLKDKDLETVVSRIAEALCSALDQRFPNYSPTYR